MLKVKMIMESVIPFSASVSEEDKRMFRTKKDDGAMYYESSRSTDEMFCLRCGTASTPAAIGEVKCPKCGNKHIRQRNYSPSYMYVRNVELIDGFLLIKESVIKLSETMGGIDVATYDVSCIVIQGNEVGGFENRLIQGYDDCGARRWTRVKKPANTYYRNQRELNCRITDEDVYEHPMFESISEDIYRLGMGDLYAKLKNQGMAVEEITVSCPEFDESLVSYDTSKAIITHQLATRKEYAVNSSEMYRLHGWCTKCGKYGQKLENRSYSMGYNCPHCKEYSGNYGRTSNCLNFFITPQEFEDGTMLLRVDEGIYRAEFVGEHVYGVDPEITYKLEICRVFYVYVMLTGKALIFNSDGVVIDKTGIENRIVRGVQVQHYICSDEQKELILNNKAVKRTGFVEYTSGMKEIDLRYFDALQKIPSLEMISKMGLHQLVHDLIYADDKDIPGYLKKEDKGTGIKRLTKPQMQSLIQSSCHLSQFVSYMQISKKDTEAMFEDFQWISNQSHSRHILDVLRVKIPNMTVKKMREYLEHVDEAQCCPVNESAQLWADYVRMLRDLDCDLTDKHLIFPNSLKREHDKAARKMTQVKDEKLNATFRERAVKNDKYAWENEEFKVLIPHDISELYEEGRKLSHCVGTYGKMVAEGRSVVAFIRKATDVDTPLCTIEIRQNAIVQARGMSNRPAENIPKMKTFIKAWAADKGLQYAA